LKLGEIEEILNNGTITIDEIIKIFKIELIKGLKKE